MEVKRINAKETHEFILKKHYAQRLPSISIAFGLFVEGNLEGILTIGKPASNSLCEGVCGKEYKQYVYELNRLCVNEGLPKNTLSQFVSKALKDLSNTKIILISYADEGANHHGYIYQATNWEYLGYFISEGFWYVDGEERHLATLWYRFKNHGNQNLTFIPGLCEMYSDVRKTWTKQFIYIMRLDNKLTPATEVLPYPKPSNEYPIKIKEHIYKQDDEVFNNFINKEKQFVEYYYE
jgi:hypothetical protein